VFDAWGPIAHDVAFGNDGARLTKGFIGVRMLEFPDGDGGLRVEGQLSGVLAGGATAGVEGDASFLQVGYRLAHGGGSSGDDGAVAVRHVRRIPFTHEEQVADGAGLTLLGPTAAPADECKAHGQLVRGTLAVRAGIGGGSGVVPFAADVSGVRHCAPNAPAQFVLEAGPPQLT